MRFLWIWFVGSLARHRPVAIALLSTVASATVSLWIQPATPNRIAYGVASFLLVFLILLVSLTPSRYAAADLVSLLLPVIHLVLGLSDKERATVHVLIGGPKQLYEQLTDYYPVQASHTKGRRFPSAFSHGIVGKAFKSREPVSWSVLEVVSEQELQQNPAQAWIRAVKKAWTFDEAELPKLQPSRLSFLAFPIGRSGLHARAILFIDSSDARRFFEDQGQKSILQIRSYFLPVLEESLRNV